MGRHWKDCSLIKKDLRYIKNNVSNKSSRYSAKNLVNVNLPTYQFISGWENLGTLNIQFTKVKYGNCRHLSGIFVHQAIFLGSCRGHIQQNSHLCQSVKLRKDGGADVEGWRPRPSKSGWTSWPSTSWTSWTGGASARSSQTQTILISFFFLGA